MAGEISLDITSPAPLRLEQPSRVLLDAAIHWRWTLWAALALLIYYPTFQTRPIFDDLGHVEFAAHQGWQLLHMGPIFFRPFERVLIGMNWMLFGDNFWLVKLAALGVLVVKASLVYELAKQVVSPTRSWAPWVIALIFLLHPMHVSAVGKIDTFSEDIAALFALLTVRFAMLAAVAKGTRDPLSTVTRNISWAAVMVLLGMLSKEAFAGIAAATPLLFAAAIGISERESRRALAYLIALEAVAGVAYFAARHAFGFSLTAPLTSAARYELHFGSNVLVNVTAALASISFPGSTLAVFLKLNAVHIAISLGILVAFLVLFRRRLTGMAARFGTLDVQHRRVTLILLIAAVAALFPSCLISELVSENQTALALPFVLLLMLASPLGVPLNPKGEDVRSASVLTCLSLVAVAWMAAASADKVLAARDASVRAYRIGDLIVTRFHEHPTAVVTVCFERSMQTKPQKYSIFSMPDDLAAYFQLYRLRVETPTPVIDVVDLRLKSPDYRPHCSLSISGASVSGS
jgi:hypothetical protein